ncbi:hypothetical protein [Adonisia turfae]|uniref:Uncharacterized protein n=1 Tax=Adonisia turfae CCMR0081 TaxID=2292702 RepID=A0A6M0RY38_9CYAN|nr:hypothetical protein [Adonisia turfae]NEZ61056.1 hypothetical protein [Adonisia turfae CCMR0081]
MAFAQAMSEEMQQQCSQLVSEAVNSLEEGRDVQVADVVITDISKGYANYPADAPIGVVFRMNGQAAADVMNSHQFMTTISTQLITECQPVSLVDFQVNYTDWSSKYGLVSGSVTRFECVEPGVGINLQWGQEFCL